jgi:hypothetical protein
MSILISNIIRKLLFSVVVLAPGAVYAANPSALFTDEVVPAGANAIACGTPLGAAAADVAAAGFTACDLYSDFTTPIPNTVGTTLPQGWLNCNGTGTPVATWYWGTQPTYNGSLFDTNPCLTGGLNSGSVGEPVPSASNSQIFQTTDPLTGGTALEIRSIPTDTCSGCSGNGVGSNPTNQSILPPAYGYTGWFYAEMYARTTLPDGPSYGAIGAGMPVNGYESGNVNSEFGCSLPGGSDYLEVDMLEEGQDSFDMALHRWDMNCGADPGDSGPNQLANGSYTDTNYHTWGYLLLGDGNGNAEACVYKDGTKLNCWTGTVDQVQENTHFYAGFGVASTTAESDGYFTYFKIWTCPAGINGASMCAVSPLPSL